MAQAGAKLINRHLFLALACVLVGTDPLESCALTSRQLCTRLGGTAKLLADHLPWMSLILFLSEMPRGFSQPLLLLLFLWSWGWRTHL